MIDEIGRADFLMHTGQVARSGDRDGLPNVVGEAMAVGTIVLAAPGGGVSEAVVDQKTGFLCSLEDASSWISAIRTVLDRPETADRIRIEARAWVERYFDADRNMKIWFEHLNGLESRGGGSNGLILMSPGLRGSVMPPGSLGLPGVWVNRLNPCSGNHSSVSSGTIDGEALYDAHPAPDGEPGG